MLSMKVGQFPVEAVLVEEKVAITREFFLSFAINDAARAPTIIFAAGGGTGIEGRADSARRITSSPRAMIKAPSEIRCCDMPRYSSATNVIASTSGIARATTNPGRRPKAQEADGEHGFANLEYRLGDIEDPPIEKGTIDPPS